MVSNLKTDETEIELSKEDKNFASKKTSIIIGCSENVDNE